MEIERLYTPNYEPGRQGYAPSGVVVHTTVGSFRAVREWFANRESRVSAHYLVGLDGRVGQFVDERDTARHAGRVKNPTTPLVSDANPNLYTIGIEFEDEGDPLGVARPSEQYRAGAELLRRIALRWGIPLDRRHVVGHREIFAAKDCPGNVDIECLLREAQLGSRHPIICLLAARNAADDLPQYLDSVARFSDGVVALDDGSTDDTLEMLAASPAVKILLRNPPRSGYRGWNDGENRNRLLRAAANLEPAWIVSIDADERLDSGDAAALRDFAHSSALAGCAFGFRLFRMWGEGHDPKFTVVYRMFAFSPEHEFPPLRLHLNPIPTAIPRKAWLRTTIRVQHNGAATEARRLARIEKYREVDPDGEFAVNLGGHSEVPRVIVPWPPRPADLPVLEGLDGPC